MRLHTNLYTGSLKMAARIGYRCTWPVIENPSGVCGERDRDKFDDGSTAWSRSRCSKHRKEAGIRLLARRKSTSNRRIFEIPQVALDLMRKTWFVDQKLAGERYIEWRQSR